MKILYSNNGLDRPTFLLAQAFSKESDGIAYNIIIDYLEEAIKDIKPDFVVINQNQMSIARDFFQRKHLDKSCKFVTVTTLTKKEVEGLIESTGLDIYNVSPSAFDSVNEYYSPTTESGDYWICEVNTDNADLLKKLQSLIYPSNKQHKIRLVNNDKFPHNQNVGIASENEMLDLIAGCDGFINLNDRYIADAVRMNKPILSFITNRFVSMSNTVSPDYPNLFKFSDNLITTPPSLIVKQCLNK